MLPPVILLAGGKSSRTAEHKALRLVDGKPYVAWQLDRLADLETPVTVVLGHEVDRLLGAITVRSVLQRFSPSLNLEAPRVGGTPQFKKKDGISEELNGLIVNPQPERGSFSSLQCGLAARLPVEPAAPSIFILPLDVPAPAAPVWRSLVDHLGDAPAVIPVHGERGGHPVLLSRPFAEALRRLPVDAPDARLDLQLGRAGAKRVGVDDPAIRLNLNTDADWLAWLANRSGSPPPR